MIDLKKLATLLGKERLTPEQLSEGLDLADELYRELGSKPVAPDEPEDINDEPPPTKFTRKALERMTEVDVVAVANSLGIEASVRDLKADTIKAILEFQK